MAKDDFVKDIYKKDNSPKQSETAYSVADLFSGFQKMMQDMRDGDGSSEMREKMKKESERLIAEVGNCEFDAHPLNLQVIGKFKNGVQWNCIWGNSSYGSEEGHIEIQIFGYEPVKPSFPISGDGIGHAPIDQMIEFLKAVKAK